MAEDFTLVAAGNTYNPALLVLQYKGYQLTMTKEESGSVVWFANKPGLDFCAYSPPELLGLVCLWESFGDDWNRQEPNLIREVARKSRLAREGDEPRL